MDRLRSPNVGNATERLSYIPISWCCSVCGSTIYHGQSYTLCQDRPNGRSTTWCRECWLTLLVTSCWGLRCQAGDHTLSDPVGS